ncbi:MAG: thermonuclease family protein [Chloroflexi bacterium]|nr:thermonuclease family protein [Chloroflexota bacterium]
MDCITRTGVRLVLLLTLLAGAWTTLAHAETPRCFAETGQCISGPIRDYWERNGGLSVFGYPITAQSAATVEGRTLQVQWFERDRLEIQADGQVTAGRLGAERLGQLGTPWQPGPNAPAAAGCTAFAETGYQICGAFASYWRANGGLTRFGYPITGEVTAQLEGSSYTVQYFERRRFEWHPEIAGGSILLGLLGREASAGAPPATASAPPAPAPTSAPAAPAPGSASPGDRVTGTVSRVIDGDTIDVAVGGDTVRIRLIGVDTPESVHPSKPVECYGREASAFLRELVQGRAVSLEIDPSQDEVDRYGRWLRYIWLDGGTLVNREIIARGYGFEYTFRTPHAYRDEFRAAEAQARDAGLGMWAPDACRATIGGDAPAAEAPAPAAPSGGGGGSTGDCPGDATAATNAPIAIIGLDKNAEMVTIRNVSDSSVALDGWWICSARAGQRHATLSGSLAPGGELIIGRQAGRPIWDNDESDPAVLYDQTGRLVSFLDD